MELWKKSSSMVSSIRNLILSLLGQFSSNWIPVVLFLTVACQVSACVANTPTIDNLEGKWFLIFEHRDIGYVRTVMNFETDGNEMKAYTRKNADRDILGLWKSLLARTFTSSFKGGSLLRLERGVWAIRNDTLVFAGVLKSAMGNFAVKGHVVGDSLYAGVLNGKQEHIGSLKGSRDLPKLPMETYTGIFDRVVALTEQRIYNRKITRSREWQDFEKNMKRVSGTVQDDLEMVFAFFYHAGQLPFSHYALMKMKPADTNQGPASYPRRAYLSEKDSGTAYLKITSFDGAATEIDSLFNEIIAQRYNNLIVDLRNNSGGSVEAGMAFARRLADTSFYGGIFLTQRWFNKHDSPPAIDQYVSFPHFTEANYDLIIEGIHEVEGLCLKVIPNEPVFRGKLFILTNGGTASTCEPIVYGLKQRTGATVIGERTAGAMLNGEVFEVGNGFRLVVPTADYYTFDGFRIDQNGVAPDKVVGQQGALEYTLDYIRK